MRGLEVWAVEVPRMHSSTAYIHKLTPQVQSPAPQEQPALVTPDFPTPARTCLVASGGACITCSHEHRLPFSYHRFHNCPNMILREVDFGFPSSA
jgi:hypothetical protein